MKKKFAFILMGGHYTPEKHQAQFETEGEITYICTVRTFEEALEKGSALAEEGVGAMELCGAFGEEWAQKMIEITGGKVAVGYVVHKPEQDPLFARFFGGE